MAIPTTSACTPDELVRDPERIVPVYVWELPVRMAHWGLVGSLVLLTVTGTYMHSPFLVADGSRAWVMGWMRFIHEMSGFLLIAIFIPRIYWFFAGNHYASWRSWIPHTARQWTSIKSMVAYYGFRRRKPFEEIGHNSLAALAYIVVFSLVALEFITGLVLFSVVEGGRMLNFTRGMDSTLHQHSVDTQRAFPHHVSSCCLLHPSPLQRLIGRNQREKRRDGKHLHRMEICPQAPCR